MGQRHVCTFRHAQRGAYRTAISAAQILVWKSFEYFCVILLIINKHTNVDENFLGGGSDVNKDWTCKDKDKDQAYKDQDKDKD